MLLTAQGLTILLFVTGASARNITYNTTKGDFSMYGGLYESALDEKNNVLYVTNSFGRPNVTKTDLLAVDPSDLKVTRDVVPAYLSGNTTDTARRYAVYGVSVDEKDSRVWLTNTRSGTVSYCNEDELTLGNQFPVNSLAYARDIYYNPKNELAYAGDAWSDTIAMFSANKKDGAERILNLTQILGTPFKGVMSFVADTTTNTLYTVSRFSGLAAGIDMANDTVKSWSLGDHAGLPSGVAWDSKRSRLYVANQKTNNTLVLEPSTGKILKDIPVSGGPLNARYDPLFDVVYVACRTGGVVTVLDAEDFSVIRNLPVGTPNHIALGKNGEIFVTDKSKESLLYKFTPQNKTENATVSSGAHSGSLSVAKSAAHSSHAAKTSGTVGAKASGSADAKASGSGSKASGSGDAKASGSKAPALKDSNAASYLSVPVAAGAIVVAALLI